MLISRPARIDEIDDLNVKLFLDDDIISPDEEEFILDQMREP